MWWAALEGGPRRRAWPPIRLWSGSGRSWAGSGRCCTAAPACWRAGWRRDPPPRTHQRRRCRSLTSCRSLCAAIPPLLLSDPPPPLPLLPAPPTLKSITTFPTSCRSPCVSSSSSRSGAVSPCTCVRAPVPGRGRPVLRGAGKAGWIGTWLRGSVQKAPPSVMYAYARNSCGMARSAQPVPTLQHAHRCLASPEAGRVPTVHDCLSKSDKAAEQLRVSRSVCFHAAHSAYVGLVLKWRPAIMPCSSAALNKAEDM